MINLDFDKYRDIYEQKEFNIFSNSDKYSIECNISGSTILDYFDKMTDSFDELFSSAKSIGIKFFFNQKTSSEFMPYMIDSFMNIINKNDNINCDIDIVWATISNNDVEIDKCRFQIQIL